MKRNVNIIAEKREKQRAQGIPLGACMDDPRTVEELLTDGPKEWFELYIENERGYKKFKPKYDALDDAKKAQFCQIFSNTDVMLTKQAFKDWLNENASNTASLESCKTALTVFIDENT